MKLGENPANLWIGNYHRSLIQLWASKLKLLGTNASIYAIGFSTNLHIVHAAWRYCWTSVVFATFCTILHTFDHVNVIQASNPYWYITSVYLKSSGFEPLLKRRTAWVPKVRENPIFWGGPIFDFTPALHGQHEFKWVTDIYRGSISVHDSVLMGTYISQVNRVTASSKSFFRGSRERPFLTFYSHLTMNMWYDHPTDARHFKRNVTATNGLILSSIHSGCMCQKGRNVNFCNPSCKNFEHPLLHGYGEMKQAIRTLCSA